MKILHLSTSDSKGGAARAAYRIHKAQEAYGLESSMLVLHKGTEDPRIIQAPPLAISTRLLHALCLRWQKFTQRGWSTDNPVLHTFGQKSGGLVGKINACDADILNLHWISNMLSIKDISRLRKPIVWTLHDMWAFCGGEHYAPDGANARFRSGYRTDNRPKGERGPDLNRKAWAAKRRAWARQRFTIVSPSCWLAECVNQSVLFSKESLNIIKYPINMDFTWRPHRRDVARANLGLPKNKKLILFGAHGGTNDSRKGADLLHTATLQMAKKFRGEVELLIYGQDKSSTENDWPYPVHWLGLVRDDQMLAQAYSAADVMVVSSRQDNLPNTAIEAQACGTPVVAFDIGGLPDIVCHKETGWLASAFDTAALAEGILWILADEARLHALSVAAREKALASFAESEIAHAYRSLYDQILSGVQVN